VNPEVKEKWVGALRSGEFRQTTGRLRSITREGPRYCCLGVLCELYRAEHPESSWLDAAFLDAASHFVPAPGVEPTGGYLPTEVVEWAGLKSRNPPLVDGPAVSATDANDNYDWDFARIADAVERSL
jgi:hypothetical protein